MIAQVGSIFPPLFEYAPAALEVVTFGTLIGCELPQLPKKMQDETTRAVLFCVVANEARWLVSGRVEQGAGRDQDIGGLGHTSFGRGEEGALGGPAGGGACREGPGQRGGA